jgi:hypothetical protein
MSDLILNELKMASQAATPGPWWSGSTPAYLMMLQNMHENMEEPLTLRSPAHTEEIATVWNYLLPTKANANLIALMRNKIDELIAVAEATIPFVEQAKYLKDWSGGPPLPAHAFADEIFALEKAWDTLNKKTMGKSVESK